MIRIVVVDDHHIVREGIVRLLAEESDFEVVAQGEDGRDVEKILSDSSADVLVLDMSMPEMDGVEVMQYLATLESQPAVVILSMQDDVSTVEQALSLGAKGYVLKQAVSDELVAAVRGAHRGSVYLSSEVAAAFLGPTKVAEPSLADRLSPREREVAELIVAGCSTKQIAAKFNTSLKTVQKQRQAALRKFDVPNTASLVRKCMELGLDGSNTT